MKSSFAKTDKRHFKKKMLITVHYSPHISVLLTRFVIASSRFTVEADKCPCCFWTEADKSILANQRTVFRSGDKATFTLKRRASWEEFSQSWLKSDRGWIISTNMMNLWYLLQGWKRKINAETFSWNLAKAACYNGEGKALCMACNHIHTVYDLNNNVCQVSTCHLRRLQRFNECFLKNSKHEMWSYLLLL